jgi:hypothetical protein
VVSRAAFESLVLTAACVGAPVALVVGLLVAFG